ncbi:hypothetical protein THEYE_A0949 [Thermodesulfovibrio yellowstonii DSM 11347]|uniref:Uncharacterized protein n=1 Tax=Thermodesulfovibrio yellowstonii (strain ATCC 51303 / DSM 11347 / YP87) TaxID=289376 RepID=B5YKM0_THEYD|nr:hypothetical protein THEYE_A0949 [Thermodesulfovibrio yellowstonii DSM 11347]
MRISFVNPFFLSSIFKQAQDILGLSYNQILRINERFIKEGFNKSRKNC